MSYGMNKKIHTEYSHNEYRMIRNNLYRYDDLNVNDNRASASIEKIIHGGNIKTATSFSSGGRNNFLFLIVYLTGNILHTKIRLIFYFFDVIHTK